MTKREKNKFFSEKKKPVKKTGAVPAEQWKHLAALASVLFLTLLTYIPALKNGLVWDDQYYIKENPLIFSVNLKEIFSRFVQGNYHPLTILVSALEYRAFGLNETGFHLVNLLLHLLNVILVYKVVMLISDKAGVALAASLLFGIHPLHVESVAWVSELKDLLYTFFFLSSYVFYLRYIKNGNRKYYVYALLLFAASLLSKAMAASLPVVLLLTDYLKGRKITARILLEKIPFFALAITLGAVAIVAQKSSNFIQDSSVFTVPQRIVFACYGFISYLFKLVVPINLSAFYPYPVKSGADIPSLFYLYVFLFLGFVFFIFYTFRYTKKIMFGLGFFMTTVFLVLQLLPVGDAIMADRYSYIPSIGIFYLTGEGLYYLYSKGQKVFAVVLLGAFALFFSVKTFERCGVWKNEMTLWNDVILHYPTAIAFNNRGNAFMNEKKYDQALTDYDQAIGLDPNYGDAHLNRGNALLTNNRNDEALRDFDKAILLKPDYVYAYYGRGNAFFNKKNYEDAISNYSKAIALKADFAGAYNGRARAEYYSGNQEAACMDLKKAVSLGHKQAIEIFRQLCN